MRHHAGLARSTGAGSALRDTAAVTCVPRLVGRTAEALGAIAGGVLAATAGIRAPMLAGAPLLAAGAAVLAWRHRRGRSLLLAARQMAAATARRARP